MVLACFGFKKMLSAPLLRDDQRMDPDLSKRWLIVGMFGMSTAVNAFMWFDYSAIPDTFQAAFGASDSMLNWTYTIALLSTLPSAPIAAIQLEKRTWGTMMTMVALNTVGALLRYLSVSAFATPVYSLALLSSVALGLSTGVILCSITFLAHTWFPPKERALAASVAAQANSGGWALGAVVVPSLVHNLHQLRKLLLVQLFVVIVTTVLFGVFYRPFPPGAARGALAKPRPERVSLVQTLQQLMRNRQYVLQGFCYTVVAGVAFAVPAVQAEIFDAHGISNITAAWTNFAFIISGVVSGVVCGNYVKRPEQFGGTLKVMFATGAVALTLLAIGLAVLDPRSTGFIAFALIMMTVAGAGLIGFLGIGLQAASEVAHPVGETYSAGLVEWMIQISAAVLTQVSTVQIGFWLCVAVTWVVVPLFVFKFDASCYATQHPLPGTRHAQRESELQNINPGCHEHPSEGFDRGKSEGSRTLQ